MFKMTVEDFIKVNGVVSVSGQCENRWKLSGRLIDDYGKIYSAYVPLGKDLIIDDSRIMLCLKGEVDIKSLKGRTLREFTITD